MSPVIIKYTIVTNGPVRRMALKCLNYVRVVRVTRPPKIVRFRFPSRQQTVRVLPQASKTLRLEDIDFTRNDTIVFNSSTAPIIEKKYCLPTKTVCVRTLFTPLPRRKTNPALIRYYPAKNINKNHEQGTANTNIASSVCLSPIILGGMQPNISRLEIRKINLAGSFTCKYIE